MLVLTLLFACNKDASDTAVTAPEDTATPQDTGGAADEDLVTSGPALPDCTQQDGTTTAVALSGVLLTPEGPEAGVVVYDTSTGLIDCVGSCDTSTAQVICTEGVISPGLINAHDHLQYNVLAPWEHADLYDDRYDWQSDGDYWDYREAYDAIEDELNCEIMKWAELRNLVGGATAAVGSSGGSCIDILVRNLDEDSASHGLSDWSMSYSSGRAEYVDSGDGSAFQDELANGSIEAVAYHVAEGIGGSVTDEIDHMASVGMAGPGFSYVHATDATLSQLAAMAEAGTSIIWSPRSNLDLYAETTPVQLASTLGVPVAVGPDWTWSGSYNPREEIACVDTFFQAVGTPWSDVDVWETVTSDASAVLGLEGRLGKLERGYHADIAVFTWSATPYRSLIDGDPQDTRLVLVGGQALFGVPELVDALAEQPSWCETLDVCGEERSVCVKQAESGDDAQTLAEIEQILVDGLAETTMPQHLDYAGELYGLFTCEDERVACDPTLPSTGDSDGDGIADSADLCPDVYDPHQGDHDLDGEGDSCDPCPLAPLTSCDHDPEDIDGDGVRSDTDVCPYLYDPDQADSDSDGHGDSCDDCPDQSNPGDMACPGNAVSVQVIADEDHADHPDEGDRVLVSGLVVTGVADNGFFAQDASLSEYAGVWVYESAGVDVVLGDVVDIDGTYEEYNGLVEILDATWNVTGKAALPAPVVIDAVCDVGDDGKLAERYEAMLATVTNVTVSHENPDTPDDYGTFEVDDCLYVDDTLGQDHEPHPAEGTSYASITGVLSDAYSHRRILPREASEVVE